jgi:hypothetical protein
MVVIEKLEHKKAPTIGRGFFNVRTAHLSLVKSQFCAAIRTELITRNVFCPTATAID